MIVFQRVFGVAFLSFMKETQVDVLLGTARSGPVRLQFAMDALSLSMRHPLLGVGIGGNKAFALIPSMLSTIGLIGTSCFLMFNAVILLKVLRRSFRRSCCEQRVVGAGLVVAFVSTFGVMAVGESMGLLLLWYWAVLAMMSSFARLKADVAQ